jgi:exosome complex protein LRP1
MANETNRLKANLSTLGESLDDIETWLEPLLAQTLPETVVGLETMQQAKLQVVLPYLVYDLVFSA